MLTGRGSEVPVELIPTGTDLDGHTFYQVRVPTAAAPVVRAFFEALRKRLDVEDESTSIAELIDGLKGDRP